MTLPVLNEIPDIDGNRLVFLANSECSIHTERQLIVPGVLDHAFHQSLMEALFALSGANLRQMLDE